jgi:PEGA domain
MATGPATAERPEAPLFADGLGERVVAVDAATGDLLQILRVRPQLLAVPSFEFALRERAARLANFRHAYYARVRRIDRHPTGLAIVSDHVEGVRLSEMLRVAHQRSLQLDLSAALCLLRQLVPSIALLHENARDVAHGLIGPERLIVTPRARLIVVEHVLGSAVEQLQFSRERLWQELRASGPASAGAMRFDHRVDVTAIGLTALALVLGRPLSDDEYPHRVPHLLAGARARAAGGEDQPLPEPLQGWIGRALQLDLRTGFASATEAQIALEDALSEDSEFVAAPVALETFLSRYIAALLEPASAFTPGAAPASHVSPPVSTPPPAAAKPTPPPAPAGYTATPPPVPAPPVAPKPAAPGFAPASASGYAAAPPPAPPIAPKPSAPIVTPPPASVVKPASPQTSMPVEDVHPSFAPMAPPVHPPSVTSVPASVVMPPPAAKAAPAPPPVPPVVMPPAPAPVSFTAPPPISPKAEPLPSPVAPQARDITELLKDFDLPSAAAEAAPAAPAVKETRPSSPRAGLPGMQGMLRIAAVVAAAAVVGLGGYYGMRAYNASKKAAAPALGTLAVQTNPPGVAVFVDGEAHGNTPARVSLKAGSHILELRGRGVPRVIPVSITAGAEASQYLELPETPSVGSLLVQSDPPGARVTIDGVDRGPAPASVAGLTPGEHDVVVQGDGGTPVRQKVSIQAGVTASILTPVTTASAGPVSGWLTVKAPVSIEVRESGRMIGTSDTDKIMMAAGRHDVELVNETLGYRATRSVQVPPGKIAAISLDMPQGSININAAPWAEVFIDGRRIGETPIGNLSIAIGSHEVLFRHPQLGEKRQAVSVTLNAPVRLSIDMK